MMIRSLSNSIIVTHVSKITKFSYIIVRTMKTLSIHFVIFVLVLRDVYTDIANRKLSS